MVRRDDELAALFGTEDEETHPSPPQDGAGVLPEPLIIDKGPDKSTPHLPPPGYGAPAEDGRQTIDELRRVVESLGVEVTYEARVGDQGAASEWDEMLDHYLVVLQRVSSEETAGEGLRLRLTNDIDIIAHDKQRIRDYIGEAFLARDAGKGEKVFERLVDAVYNEVVGLSVLAPLWWDPDITEILVDGWDEVYYEKDGKLSPTPIRFRSPKHLSTVARNLAEAVSDRGLSQTNPLVSAQLPSARVAFVYGSVAGDDEVYITIRKHHHRLEWEDLLAYGALTPEMRDFLGDCVRARANILISGGTGAGKTTIINAVSGYIPDDERVVTIEDNYELELRNRYWVKLQSKVKASADDLVDVSISDLLVQTLRMRPDRIVVGEVRNPEATVALLEAANTGHDGTLTTVHANSGHDAVNFRLPALYQHAFVGSALEVGRAEVSRAFDLVVHVARRKQRRFIASIDEIGRIDPVTGEVQLRRLYTGAVTPERETVFSKVSNPWRNGDLARKFDEAGIELETDEETLAGAEEETLISPSPAAGESNESSSENRGATGAAGGGWADASTEETPTSSEETIDE